MRPMAAGLAGAVLARALHSQTQAAKQPPLEESAPAAHSLDSLTYKGQYRGQLTPPLPSAGASATATGPVVHDSTGKFFLKLYIFFEVLLQGPFSI